jgi:serine/threonine protein kinase
VGKEPLKENDPKKLGEWRIINRLGEGGFGTVFLAERGAQQSAIKILRNDLDSNKISRDDLDSKIEAPSRFKLEIAALEKLADPFIARVLDFDLSAETPWFATEYVNGPTLETKVKYEGVLKDLAWFLLASNLFHALTASHAAGIVHKDVKPSNIILGESGNKLIDFGISHISGMDLTQHNNEHFGEFEGSIFYCSPESFSGKSLSSMDVFSAASTLAFAGKGRSIWLGDDVKQLMKSIIYDQPDLNDLTELQQDFLTPLLNKDSSERPTSQQAYQMINRILETHDDKGFSIDLTSWKESGVEPPRKKKKVKVTALVAMIILFLSGFFLLVPKNTTNELATKSDDNISSVKPEDVEVQALVDPEIPLISNEIKSDLDKSEKYFKKNEYTNALIFAKKAAQAGSAKGLYRVAYILVEQGKKAEAVSWYEKAANLGYGDAFRNLGDLYMSLNETELAITWYEKGVQKNSIESLNALGFYYSEKKKDYIKSKFYYQKSANLGDVMGMYNLGLIFNRLNDKVNAKKWYIKASDLGSIDASINLGFFYENETDWTNARKYYQRAADKKDPLAMYDLALVLGNHFGQGDKGCILLKEALTIKTIEPSTKELVEDTIKTGCLSSKISAPKSKAAISESVAENAEVMPKPNPSSSGTFDESPEESTGISIKGIFGRSWPSGFEWNVPLTNSSSEKVPPVTNLQFRLLRNANKIWVDIGYKLKVENTGVYAQVDKLFLDLSFKEIGFKDEVCPEFRFVRIENNKVVNIWQPGQPECATDYKP